MSPITTSTGSHRGCHRRCLRDETTASIVSLMLVCNYSPGVGNLLWRAPRDFSHHFLALNSIICADVPFRNELPTDLHEPCQTQSPSLSPITHGSSSSSSSPSLRSPLASSHIRSVFHSELKTWLFGKSFPP